MVKVRLTAAALSLLALAAVPVRAQDKPQAPAMSGADEAMMKAITPGEPQKKLARLAGDWTYTSKAWTVPGQPAMESNGTMHGEVLMGGRYVEHTWKGAFMGMQFEGRGTEAYDNLAKMYVNSWVDNMGTGIMQMTGTCDEGVKSCTYTGEVWDPMTGKKTPIKQVITWMDDNNFKNEMYGPPGPDGKEGKTMEIVAKRK